MIKKFEDMINRDRKKRKPRMFIYGPGGIGKSTLAAHAPANVFIDLDDGLDEINDQVNINDLGWCRTLSDLGEQVEFLKKSDHGFKTVTIDTADRVEAIYRKEACRHHNVDDISEVGWNKGYDYAHGLFLSLIDDLIYLNKRKDMAIIVLAHSVTAKYSPPDAETYDRYMPKLYHKTDGIFREMFDCVFFVNKTLVTKTGKDKKIKAIDTSALERRVYTAERPAFFAKNRYQMPDVMPMDFAAIAAAMKKDDKK